MGVVGVSILPLIFLLIPLASMGFLIWFMIRIVSLLQRMSLELESISRTLQSRP